MSTAAPKSRGWHITPDGSLDQHGYTVSCVHGPDDMPASVNVYYQDDAKAAERAAARSFDSWYGRGGWSFDGDPERHEPKPIG